MLVNWAVNIQYNQRAWDKKDYLRQVNYFRISTF